LANGGMLCAQTNTNVVAATATNAAVKTSMPAATNVVVSTPVSAAPAAPPPIPEPLTLISADRGEFDMVGRVVTYHGHVRVDDPEMKLKSEWLITDLPQPGEHVNRIVAETNVVIDFLDDKGRTNRATGDRTVYSYAVKDGTTNELVTLSGNAKVENAEFIMTGEPIVLDLITRKITANNLVMVPRHSLINPNAGTNSPPATKPPASLTSSPPTNRQSAVGTNFPPMKLDPAPDPRVTPRTH